MSQTQGSVNPSDIWDILRRRMPSPTTLVKSLATTVNTFCLAMLGTGAKVGNVPYYKKLRDEYVQRMEAFLPRFLDAQGQELATWHIQHPTATPDEQAAYAAQQEQDLTDFVGQLAAWHDAYMAKWSASPLATQ